MRSHISGVDELILAAKIEESTSRAAASAAYHLPTAAQSTTTNTATNSSGVCSGYLANMSSYPACHSSQQSTFMAPIMPYVPTGRGLGYPCLSTLTDYRDRMLQPTPRSKSELELYTLLDRANLLQYFETFLKFGGDDVQQLSDADEDEFLEIMRLIGMTNKPLHIRRLQKALCDWRDNQSVHDSIDSSFKRPGGVSCSAQQDPSSSHGSSSNGQGLYYNPHLGECLSTRSSTFMVESPAPTPTNSEVSSQAAPFSVHELSQQQYCTPLEVIVNAPKRPRLMDSIKPRDLTQTYHSDIPTPDARQLNVRKAIIDKRKRDKMALQQQQQQSQEPPVIQQTSASNRSHEDDNSKLTPTSSTPPSHKWTASGSSCGSPNVSDPEERDDDRIIHDDYVPKKRKSSVRTSLLSRFENSATDKQLVPSKRLTSSPITKN